MSIAPLSLFFYGMSDIWVPTDLLFASIFNTHPDHLLAVKWTPYPLLAELTA
jgi:hypothetical protein